MPNDYEKFLKQSFNIVMDHQKVLQHFFVAYSLLSSKMDGVVRWWVGMGPRKNVDVRFHDPVGS